MPCTLLAAWVTACEAASSQLLLDSASTSITYNMSDMAEPPRCEHE